MLYQGLALKMICQTHQPQQRLFLDHYLGNYYYNFQKFLQQTKRILNYSQIEYVIKLRKSLFYHECQLLQYKIYFLKYQLKRLTFQNQKITIPEKF